MDERGHVNRAHGRAMVLNGSDSLGGTHVRILPLIRWEFSNRAGLTTAPAQGKDIAPPATAQERRSPLSRAWRRSMRPRAPMALTKLKWQAASASGGQGRGGQRERAKGSASKLPPGRLHDSGPDSGHGHGSNCPSPAAVPAAGSTIQSTIPATVVPVP